MQWSVKTPHNESDFWEYFEKDKDIRIDKGVADEDFWNMDETGFRAGCGRAHWVITLDPEKPMLLTDPDNREYITSVESYQWWGENNSANVDLVWHPDFGKMDTGE